MNKKKASPERIPSTQMSYYLQDSDVNLKNSGIGVTTFKTLIETGPRDKHIRIVGPRINRVNNHFKLKSSNATLEKNQKKRLDSIHTFATIRLLLNMYQKAFSEIKVDDSDLDENGDFDFLRKWGKPISVYLITNKGINASYSPEFNAIDFGEEGGINTCRSFDIVTHEAAHSIFEAIRNPVDRKKKMPTVRPEISEGFADISIIFSLLNQKTISDIIVKITDGEIRSYKNFIPRIGEQFSVAHEKYQPGCIRNLSDINFLYLNKTKNPRMHSKSLMFTGGIYEFIMKVFNKKKEALLKKSKNIHEKEFNAILSEELRQVGWMVTKLTLAAFYNIRNVKELSFKKIGLEMKKLVAAQHEEWLPIFINIFREFKNFTLTKNI